MRQNFLLIVAVCFGLLAFLLTYQQINAEKDRIRGETIEIGVVRVNRDFVEGETIAAGDLLLDHLRRYPKDISDNDVLWDRRNDVVGQKAARIIRKSEMLRYSDLLAATGSQRRGVLAGIIKQGERAISIAVDATSSVTGLIRPNDKVDIIGTFRFPEMKGDQALDTITLTLLQGVMVLATGSELGGTGENATAARRTQAKGYSTVTLALSPKEVEMVIFATQKGKLTLSLRNTEDTGFVDIKDLQSVNFRLLEQKIPQYNQERQQRTMGGRR